MHKSQVIDQFNNPDVLMELLIAVFVYESLESWQ